MSLAVGDAEALAREAARLAVAVREVLGPADAGAVGAADARAPEAVALGHAGPSLRRPHLCNSSEATKVRHHKPSKIKSVHASQRKKS